MSFWRGLVAGGILGLFAGALLLSEDEDENQNRAVRLRERVPRLDRAQRMVRKMVKLADLMK
ncbi:MAG: hypothetical protein AB1374_11810 [Bacillota bacterium]